MCLLQERRTEISILRMMRNVNFRSGKPFALFVFLSVVFLLFEYFFQLIRLNYSGVHLYFGLVFPLILGYVPLGFMAWKGFARLPIERGYT